MDMPTKISNSILILFLNNNSLFEKVKPVIQLSDTFYCSCLLIGCTVVCSRNILSKQLIPFSVLVFSLAVLLSVQGTFYPISWYRLLYSASHWLFSCLLYYWLLSWIVKNNSRISKNRTIIIVTLNVLSVKLPELNGFLDRI